MRKRILAVVLGLVLLSNWAGCHTHHHCESDDEYDRKRDGVHVRAPYTKVDVTWSEDGDDDDYDDDDDDEDGDVEVDVEVDD